MKLKSALERKVVMALAVELSSAGNSGRTAAGGRRASASSLSRRQTLRVASGRPEMYKSPSQMKYPFEGPIEGPIKHPPHIVFLRAGGRAQPRASASVSASGKLSGSSGDSLECLNPLSK